MFTIFYLLLFIYLNIFFTVWMCCLRAGFWMLVRQCVWSQPQADSGVRLEAISWIMLYFYPLVIFQCALAWGRQLLGFTRRSDHFSFLTSALIWRTKSPVWPSGWLGTRSAKLTWCWCSFWLLFFLLWLEIGRLHQGRAPKTSTGPF